MWKFAPREVGEDLELNFGYSWLGIGKGGDLVVDGAAMLAAGAVELEFVGLERLEFELRTCASDSTLTHIQDFRMFSHMEWVNKRWRKS